MLWPCCLVAPQSDPRPPSASPLLSNRSALPPQEEPFDVVAFLAARDHAITSHINLLDPSVYDVSFAAKEQDLLDRAIKHYTDDDIAKVAATIGLTLPGDVASLSLALRQAQKSGSPLLVANWQSNSTEANEVAKEKIDAQQKRTAELETLHNTAKSVNYERDAAYTRNGVADQALLASTEEDEMRRKIHEWKVAGFKEKGLNYNTAQLYSTFANGTAIELASTAAAGFIDTIEQIIGLKQGTADVQSQLQTLLDDITGSGATKAELVEWKNWAMYERQMKDNACWRYKDRGVGHIPNQCNNPSYPDNNWPQCYARCPSGYNNVGCCICQCATLPPTLAHALFPNALCRNVFLPSPLPPRPPVFFFCNALSSQSCPYTLLDALPCAFPQCACVSLPDTLPSRCALA